ncbi:hypothetical protein [Nocardiopsis dassonvillei]
MSSPRRQPPTPFTPGEAEQTGRVLAAAAYLARDLPEREDTDRG